MYRKGMAGIVLKKLLSLAKVIREAFQEDVMFML